MRKPIAIAVLAGALTITGISGASAVGDQASSRLGVSPVTTPGPNKPNSYDQPPGIRLVNRVLNRGRFTLRRTVRVGTIVCGTGTCTVSAKRSFAAVRRSARFKANLIAPSPLSAGQIAPLKVKLSKKAFRKIKNGTKNGHGHARFSLTLTSTPGYEISADGNARYQSKKRKK
jgi:hypothetical protein